MAKNDLHEKLLKALEMQLQEIKDSITELQLEIIDEGITQHPILIAHRGEAEFGEPILDRKEYNMFYDINVSSLEEMVELGILLEDKIEDFKHSYGSSRNNTCILCVFPDGEAQFVFYSLANRKTDNEPT